jgi:hypothetical protein
VRKYSLQSDFAEGCEDSGRVVGNRDQQGHVEVNTRLSGNADLTQCTDRKSLQRSPFAVDEPTDCRKQYAHRYSAHQDANDALQRP